MFHFILAFFAVCVISSHAQSVPSLTTYQGRLTDASGIPVADGAGYEVELRLWPAATGGTTPIWASRYSGVAVKGGALNVILGSPSGTPISGATTTDIKAAFAPPNVFIAMTVTRAATGTPIANPSEILPRQQWMSAPFAFRAESVSDSSITSASIADGTVQKSDLSSSLQTELNQLVPSGTVIAFAGQNVPPGWLKCDGANVSRTQYNALFAAIGTAHGSGDESTTFTLPDYRGFFLRGVNEGAVMPDGVTPRDPDTHARVTRAPGGATGNAVGSVQLDEVKAHSHKTDGSDQGSRHPVWAGGSDSFIDYYSGKASSEDANYIAGSKTGVIGGAETRPKNAYVLYIIKF